MPPLIHAGHWEMTKRGRPLGPHRNAGLELVLVKNGSVTWDYEGTKLDVPPGHISFSWPWEWHGARDGWVPASELFWVILPLKRRQGELQFDRHLGLLPAESRALLKELTRLSRPVVRASRLAMQMFPAIVASLAATEQRPSMNCRAMLLLLLAEIREEAVRAPHSEELAGARARVRHWVTSLPENCSEPISLEEMAACCSMGRTNFCRHVKELTGETPVQFLNRVRVERAKKLLREGQSVTETAFACGFATSQYFATVYKNFTGRRPSEEIPSQVSVRRDR